MKPKLSLIAAFKILDILLQTAIIGIVITVMACIDFNLYALFLIALIQYISAIIWAVIGRYIPHTKNRKALQTTFLAAGTYLLFYCLIAWYQVIPDIVHTVVQLFTDIILFAGPVVCVWYFITTLQEILFYKRFSDRNANNQSGTQFSKTRP